MSLAVSSLYKYEYSGFAARETALFLLCFLEILLIFVLGKMHRRICGRSGGNRYSVGGRPFRVRSKWTRAGGGPGGLYWNLYKRAGENAGDGRAPGSSACIKLRRRGGKCSRPAALPRRGAGRWNSAGKDIFPVDGVNWVW